mmetsp:Transcript_62879/g.146405  ORF Transcript_62879/g.146405 Transcript_62879/m.146405 type:complete len:211 (+) Transcript_62879:139-771(+)
MVSGSIIRLCCSGTSTLRFTGCELVRPGSPSANVSAGAIACWRCACSCGPLSAGSICSKSSSSWSYGSPKIASRRAVPPCCEDSGASVGCCRASPSAPCSALSVSATRSCSGISAGRFIGCKRALRGNPSTNVSSGACCSTSWISDPVGLTGSVCSKSWGRSVPPFCVDCEDSAGCRGDSLCAPSSAPSFCASVLSAPASSSFGSGAISG